MVDPVSVPPPSESAKRAPRPSLPSLKTRWVWQTSAKRSDPGTVSAGPTPLSSDGVWRKVVEAPESPEGPAVPPPASECVQHKAIGVPDKPDVLASIPTLSLGSTQQSKSKASAKKGRRVLEVAPNGNDLAIILVSLGFFLSAVLFAIFRVVAASHQ